MDFIKQTNYFIFKYINDNIKELNINFNNNINIDGNFVLNDKIISYYDYVKRERVNLQHNDNKELYDFLFYLLDNNYINDDNYVNLYNFADIYNFDEIYLYNNVFQETKYYYILLLIPILFTNYIK